MHDFVVKAIVDGDIKVGWIIYPCRLQRGGCLHYVVVGPDDNPATCHMVKVYQGDELISE